MIGRWCTVAYDDHSHTNASDGDGDPRRLIEWHLSRGYTAFAVTDHNTVEAYPEAKRLTETVRWYRERIVVLPGVEWTTRRFHAIVVFRPSLPFDDIRAAVASLPVRWVSDASAEVAVEMLHALGAVVSLAHPQMSRDTIGLGVLDIEAAARIGFDCVEITNGEKRDRDAYQRTIALGRCIVAGSDTHHLKMGSNYYTVLAAREFTAESVFEELAAGRTIISPVPGIRPYVS